MDPALWRGVKESHWYEFRSTPGPLWAQRSGPRTQKLWDQAELSKSSDLDPLRAEHEVLASSKWSHSPCWKSRQRAQHAERNLEANGDDKERIHLKAQEGVGYYWVAVPASIVGKLNDWRRLQVFCCRKFDLCTRARRQNRDNERRD